MWDVTNNCNTCDQVFNVNLKQAAWFSAVPWGTMAISGYIAGATSDFLIRTGYSLTLVRKIMQVAFSFSPVLLVVKSR